MSSECSAKAQFKNKNRKATHNWKQYAHVTNTALHPQQHTLKKIKSSIIKITFQLLKNAVSMHFILDVPKMDDLLCGVTYSNPFPPRETELYLKNILPHSFHLKPHQV